jgi:hypothetical protein
VIVLVAFGLIQREHLRGYAWVYSLIPLLLVPRYWQSVAKAGDGEQPLSASLFGLTHLRNNLSDYFRLLLSPLDLMQPHSPLLMVIAIGGYALIAIYVVSAARAGRLKGPPLYFLAFVSAMFGMEALVCFAYMWGKPLHAASVRLFVWLDTFVAFGAAHAVCWVASRLFAWSAQASVAASSPEGADPERAPETTTNATTTAPAPGRGLVLAVALACGAIMLPHVPVAAEARFFNALILTRQAAQTWRYFETLNDKRILVLSDRPGLFTIMNYGAVDISTAGNDRSPILELSRHLYQAVYLVQEVDLATGKPLPGFAPWPDAQLETMLEFQNTESASVRIARLKP